MQSTVVYAFLVVALAPLIGIWRGHAWAKSQGFTLRPKVEAEQDQVA